MGDPLNALTKIFKFFTFNMYKLLPMYSGLNREYVCAVCYVSPTRYDCNINNLLIMAQPECNPIKSD